MVVPFGLGVFWLTNSRTFAAGAHVRYLWLITSRSTDFNFAQLILRIALCEWNMLEIRLGVNKAAPHSSLPNP
jgi:hypothetical protein